jgi:hypothetical protein
MDEEKLNSPELTVLERAVLVAALSGDDKVAVTLNSQAHAAKALIRTPSGVGFVTKLQVPEKYCLPDSLVLDSLPLVFGRHPDLPSGAEFVLQVKDGRLNSIEAFCFEGMWPRDESLFTVEVGTA